MKITKLFKALSDPSRVRALSALQKHELCVCQIIELLGLAPSTVSKHMSVLASAGLVESTKKGRWVYYRPAEDDDSQTGRILSMLPDLATGETQIRADQQALTHIVDLDPETLCRLQSERSEN